MIFPAPPPPFYFMTGPLILYEIWDFAPMNSKIVVHVIRPLCGSLKIDSNRTDL
jgi:hypothetical protein